MPQGVYFGYLEVLANAEIDKYCLVLMEGFQSIVEPAQSLRRLPRKLC